MYISDEVPLLLLTVVVSLVKMIRVQGMIVFIHRTIQKVLWVITHELSDPGGKKIKT